MNARPVLFAWQRRTRTGRRRLGAEGNDKERTEGGASGSMGVGWDLRRKDRRGGGLTARGEVDDFVHARCSMDWCSAEHGRERPRGRNKGRDAGFCAAILWSRIGEREGFNKRLPKHGMLGSLPKPNTRGQVIA
jgi:hypothetical protein